MGHKGYHHSKETLIKIGKAVSIKLKGRATRGTGWHHTIEYRRKKAAAYTGNKSHFWKGGLTSKNKKIRNSCEWKIWREAVFARDNWTCQHCKKRDGRELHPHHIKSFTNYPKLQFVVKNGVTLCKKCHLKKHYHKF